MVNITRLQNAAITPKTRTRVAAYARVSMDTEQLSHSLSAQVSYYSELIQKNPGWEYAGVYADLGITGTSTAHRREFNRLIAEFDPELWGGLVEYVEVDKHAATVVFRGGIAIGV